MIESPKSLTEQLLNLTERIASEMRAVYNKIGNPVRKVNGVAPNESGELSIDTSLRDNSVTTAKIANANVTTAKLSDGSVTTAKIADGNVTATKLADSAVGTAKINSGAVTADKIATGSVTADKIAEGALYTYGTADLTAGTSPLETGKLYFVYEE